MRHPVCFDKIKRFVCANENGDHLPQLELLHDEGLDGVAGLGDGPADHTGGVPGISGENNIEI